MKSRGGKGERKYNEDVGNEEQRGEWREET